MLGVLSVICRTGIRCLKLVSGHPASRSSSYVSVSINGKPAGKTPLRLSRQRAGSLAVQIAYDGFERWSAAVLVPADRLRTSPRDSARPRGDADRIATESDGYWHQLLSLAGIRARKRSDDPLGYGIEWLLRDQPE